MKQMNLLQEKHIRLYMFLWAGKLVGKGRIGENT